MMFDALLIIFFGFLFSALFSGVETGSYMISRIRLRQGVRDRRHSALALSRLLSRPYIFIYTVLIGNNIAVFVVSREVTDLYLSAGLSASGMVFGFLPWNAGTAATLTLMFPLFLLAEVGPKNLFRKKAEILMYRLARLMRLLVLLLLPVTWPLKQLFRFLTHGVGSAALRDLHQLSPEALRDYFSVGEKEGVISSDLSRMMDKVTSMHEVPVRMLMTPFKDVPQLPENATVADFKRLAARHEKAYAVLTHKHHVVGMIDLFTVVNRRLEENAPLKPYAEDMLRLPENRNLKSAFYRLRRNPHHSAVVLDARGHSLGFVQLEDIARYIANK